MNVFLVDLTHGGVKISSEHAKSGKYEKLFAYDIYKTLKKDDYKLGFIEKDSNRIVFNKNWNILLCTSQSRKWYGLREYPEHLLFKTSNCSN